MSAKIVVAGHICLDMIPTFPPECSAAIQPGRLYIMGPVVNATGGAVSNTGLALHQLGVPTKLLGKVGNDLFGGEILNILRSYGPELADGMIVAEGESSSYTVVISPPDIDRSFLHCPGTNDTFRADDVEASALAGATLLHFGYPTLMQKIYEDGGEQAESLMQQARGQGLMTSLDMAMPDPSAAAGQVDWRHWLERVMPSVDVFLPSIDEISFMLRRELFDQFSREGVEITSAVGGELLNEVAEELLGMGTEVVVLKLGDQGIYLRTGEPKRLSKEWHHRELATPCFAVDVVGTTGAGDSTIAGFLAALVENASPEEAVVQAVGVGACSVEAADATRGIRPMTEVQERIAAGWARLPVAIDVGGWKWEKAGGYFVGPRDGQM